MKRKLKVGIIGATGMVGRTYVSLLESHPWFDIAYLAASPASAGKTYQEAVAGRWNAKTAIPEKVKNLTVRDAADVRSAADSVDFVFCAIEMPKEETRKLEDEYAKSEIPVVSNNSAHRMTPDVPMIVPELNAEHAVLIEPQRKRLGTRRGFITVKSNCSIQSYVPALHPLRQFGPELVMVSTYQAISGAGKTFETWPEMVDNVIPYIGGEEEKSEKEPLRIWGTVDNNTIALAKLPIISAQCIRVPVSHGHLAAVSVSFREKPSREQILDLWKRDETPIKNLGLPSAPAPFLRYFEEDNRPQTRFDRDAANGMGITIGRLREDPILDWKFISLSHNTIRGAAGGSILTAELLAAQSWI